MTPITQNEAETYRRLAESLHAAGEMPLEGEATDPLIEVFNSLGHQAGDAITRLLSLATPDPAEVRGRIRWGVPYIDGPLSAFLGRKKIGVVLPLHEGGWIWIDNLWDQNGIEDTREAAKAALETAVREAINAE